ncbi:TIGR03943 family putative permease subunit [Texcoconibacillus texcoconensis]|uniref:Putative membrane protein n=1 Tax=Texcoconibacillus texcoconensis TaxID=1095777 RepID=A0A840QNQ3_9BACI|nr:TIGR03943 family protein [Texcoconibacillus texcoconensis]MBB5172999.1 putative membrane protein [Texcoconibacillus texcoconensis]
MKRYDHRFHAYIQGIILLGFALLILGFIITDNIRYYIAPDMMPFIYFALVMFFILGIMQIFRSTQKDDAHEGTSCDCSADHEMKGPPFVKVLIYSIFILPILFGFVLPDQALDSSVAANRGIQFGSGILNEDSSEKASAETAEEESVTEEDDDNDLSRAEAYLEDPDGYLESIKQPPNTDEYPSEDEVDEHYTVEDIYAEQDDIDDHYEEVAQEMLDQESIFVTEENYLDIMSVLDLRLDSFVGQEIEIIGFTYREPDFLENQLVVARFSMTCCTADAAVYGTLVESDEAIHFDDDTWIHVHGTIEAGEYDGMPMPVLTDATINQVEEPDTPYVYPSFSPF